MVKTSALRLGSLVCFSLALGLLGCGQDSKDGHPAAASVMGNCKLEKPIPLDSDDLVTAPRFSVKNVQLDQKIKSEEIPEAFKFSNMKMSFFRISTSGTPTNYLGARLELEGRMMNFGFANDYIGNLRISGANNRDDASQVYTTTTKTETSGHDAVTELKVVVDQKAIVGITLQIPVYTQTTETNGRHKLNFNGEHQTLCIKSATK